MVSLDIVALVIYLLPGYMISAFRHYVFIGKRERETARAIESIVLSMFFYAILIKTHTVTTIIDSIQKSSILSIDILQRFPLLIIFVIIGAILYSVMYFLWIIVARELFGRSPQRFVYHAFSKRMSKKKIYFKLDGDDSLFRGTLSQDDLDEGTEIWLINIQVKKKTNYSKAMTYQYFADNMIINRDKVVYLFTRNE